MADKTKDETFDAKTVEKSPLTLDKLPVDVLEEVTSWLSLVDCLSLRKVSRDLREFVDSTERHCEELSFIFGDSYESMRLDDLEIEYVDMKGEGCQVISNRENTQKTRTHRDDRNFKQVFMTDASTLLQMPKLEIGQIKFVGKDKGLELVQSLKTRNLPLNVRSIWSKNLELLHSIQDFLKLEKLEEIVCDAFDYVNEFNELATANMEILKNPKLKLEILVFDRYSDESLAKFSEILKSINSQLNIQIVHAADGRWIPAILQYSNPEKMEKMIINQFVNLTVDQFNAIAREKQWREKTIMRCDVPEEIGLEELVDFKEFEFLGFTEENLIIIRDIILKSPHFDSLKLVCNPIVNEQFEDELNEIIDIIMSEDPAYDVSTRRFSIPNSQDYFQLELKEEWTCLVLTIRRTSEE